MDPIANLKEMRELARKIIQDSDRDYPAGLVGDMGWQEDAERLAELVLALDTWRLKGGFDPYTQGKV